MLLKSAESRSELFVEAFRKTHDDISNSNFDASYSGSTANTVFLHGSLLVCANVGDSRTILGSLDLPETGAEATELDWSARQVSIDHKPEVQREYERIISHNGRVDTCRG